MTEQPTDQAQPPGSLPPAPPPAPQEHPAPKPYGPGVLMFFGLALLAFSAWCAKDFFWPAEEWVKEGRTGTIWLNGAMALAALAGAVYAFVLAYVRSRKAAD